jgi:trimeric autotransporter adhesin
VVSGSRAVPRTAKGSAKFSKFLLRSSLIFALLVANFIVLAQTQTSTGATVQGIVGSGQFPLPGVEVTVTGADGKKIVTTTGVNGQYQLKVPATGQYTIDVALAAFAPASKEVNVTDLAQPVRMDFDLMLRSRVPQQQAAAVPAQETIPLAARGARGGRGGQQNPTLLQTNRARGQDANGQAEDDLTAAPPDLQVAGAAADAPTESVAVLGNAATNPFGDNQNFNGNQIRDLIDQQFGNPGGGGGDNNGAGGGRGGNRGGGGGGNFQGGGGGRGGGGGNRGGGFAFGRGGRGFGATTPRGNISYQLQNSFFNAQPFSVTGAALPQPTYGQNYINASVGGPLYIPHVVKTTTTSYTVTFSVTRNSTVPAQQPWIVPTLAERNGDFSQATVQKGSNIGAPVQIFNPFTGAPFQNNIIDPSLLSSAAVGLLQYIPLPNQNIPGTPQNFVYNYTNTTSTNNLNIRLNHTFGPPPQQGRGQRGGGNGGRQGGGGRGGGRRGTNINFGLQFTGNTTVNNSPVSSIKGNTTTNGLNATFGFVKPFGRINNSLNLNLNRSHSVSTNFFAGNQNIEGALGILGTSTNSFDWGLPSLSFTNFQGVTDRPGSIRLNQTERISDDLGWNRGKHNVRWGFAFQTQQQDNHSTANSRGTFTFSGARTAALAADGTPLPGTGFDFADFLLGLPQQTSLQYGALTYHFRGNAMDAYIQDDWRALGKLTLQMSFRWDYNTPYHEANNSIANLDVAPDFSNAVLVLPGQVGPYHGLYPRSLVKPDYKLFSPRLGIAWRASAGTVVRAGYGITFNGAAYSTMAAQMSNQPPFSTAEKNTYSSTLPLTLQNGFVTPTGVSNTYGIDPNYRIGYAQQWDLSVQRELQKLKLQLLVDYTGTKGTHLDLVEAPNLTASGALRIPNVQDFKYETWGGDSILHSGLIRVSRRQGRGMSFQGTYQFSKSIDDASTVSGGGGGGTAIQNAFNRLADRGLSSFDQPHRVTIQYGWELPAGTNKPFFSEGGPYKAMFGDWQLTGTWNYNSGTPLTILAPSTCYTNLTGVTNGTLRANATGLPVSVSNRSVAGWFNTGAFACPTPGQYGNAGKNTLRNPGLIAMGAQLNKTVVFADGRSFDIRLSSTNPLNMVQYSAINTTLNSPTFGRVTGAANMRTAQIMARFNF